MRRHDVADELESHEVRDRRRRRVEHAPAAVTPGSLAWASAVGNQAVQRVARERMIAREVVEDAELPLPEAALAADEAEPTEAVEPEPDPEVEGAVPPAAAEGLDTEQLEALDAVPDEGESLV